MRLRLAETGDADRIRDLLVVTFTPYAHALGHEPEALDWVPERIRAGDVWWCDADALAEVGVAVLDRAGTTLNLDRLAIAPEHQKSRHGTAALRAVEALGLSLGADRMISQDRAALYASCGLLQPGGVRSRRSAAKRVGTGHCPPHPDGQAAQPNASISILIALRPRNTAKTIRRRFASSRCAIFTPIGAQRKVATEIMSAAGMFT